MPADREAPKAPEPVREPFRLGINYWPSRTAMGWWQDFDAAETAGDLELMAERGFDAVRFFLTWEVFQPAPDRVDTAMLDRLVTVADLAERAGMAIMPTLFTGHMSGLNLVPDWALGGSDRDPRFRVLAGGRLSDGPLRNWYTDPAVREAQAWLAGQAAAALAGHPALWAWDLGNENSNCVRPPDRSSRQRLAEAHVRGHPVRRPDGPGDHRAAHGGPGGGPPAGPCRGRRRVRLPDHARLSHLRVLGRRADRRAPAALPGPPDVLAGQWCRRALLGVRCADLPGRGATPGAGSPGRRRRAPRGAGRGGLHPASAGRPPWGRLSRRHAVVLRRLRTSHLGHVRRSTRLITSGRSGCGGRMARPSPRWTRWKPSPALLDRATCETTTGSTSSRTSTTGAPASTSAACTAAIEKGDDDAQVSRPRTSSSGMAAMPLPRSEKP